MTCFVPLLLVTICSVALGQATKPATGVGKFPHVEVDVPTKEVRVECESLNPQMALEFFCVMAGTSEHEAVLRTQAKPSHIHTALLMLGLKPGQGVRFDEKQKKWLPPEGPPIVAFVETERSGKPVREPATSWVRDLKSKKPMPADFKWVFAGSRLMPDGNYAADVTGYILTLVNFDLSLIDVPKLQSSSNETLEWEYDPEKVPAKGTKVTLILRPAEPEKK